ncbi:MAG: ATP-grasp domain-containing protein [Planctomycetes bacterium]|nr:ATP-grasp domain-containing protein [Planctomycetota bacterium]
MLIVGASVRAAAYSAWRAGLQPWSADLFGDRDLRVASARAGTPCRRVQRYPHDFLDISRQGPAGPWMYTGALENHPHVVAEISRLRPLWGNSPEVLAKVRDPFLVAQALAEEGLPHPEVRPSADDLPRDGTWLIKPLHSAGGAGIRVLLPTTRLSIPAVECCVGDRGRHGRLPRPYYLQQFVDGLPCSALYLAAGGQALLLGVTRQLVGEAAFHARTFTYCGSIGPLNLQRQIVERFGKLGRVLARRFGLIGLFGVDCVLRDGHPFPVEINPRWTASVEVLEYALGFCAMQLHADACRGRLADPLTHQFLLPATRRLADPPPRVPCVGKAILYADNDRIAPEPHAWFKAFSGEPFSARQPPDPTPMPPVADIPFAGQRLLRGRPVMTLLVRGESVEGCITMLQDRSAAALEMCSPP